MKDWRGTKIKVGQTVVYPSRQGSSLWMTEGVVVEVNPNGYDDRRVGVTKKGGTRISYPALQRLTVLPCSNGACVRFDP